MLKVPGGGVSSSPPAGDAVEPQRAGIGNIPLICPFCGTRMYADRSQVGKTMVCPECLETVAVHVASESQPPADPDERLPIPESVPPATPATPPDPKASETAGEDEFRLSEPETLPSAAFWSKDLADALQEEGEADPSRQQEPVNTADHRIVPPSPPQAPTAAPSEREFRVKCSVCDTMVYVTTDEIGKTKKCPDCFTEFEVPRPTTKQATPVPDVMKDAGEFALSEPVERLVFKDMETDLVGRTVGQEQLAKAEKEKEEKEWQQPKLPKQPLWTGVFRFWQSGEAFLSLVFIAGIFWTICFATIVGAAYAAKGGLGIFVMMICAVGVMAILLTGGAYAAVTGLRILQDTAAGLEKVESWPDLAFLDWCLEALYVAVAFAYSMTPGILVSWSMGKMGISPSVGYLVSMVSLFALFPIVLLSLMEADALTAPLTKPIMQSLQKERSHWVVFYLESVAILIIVLVAGSLIYLESLFALFLATSIWSFCWMTYFRLLGRLAWISGAHQNAG
jgi:DNA-directed RNA polymerase subunit M/transcription elongation factor TFIIS